MYAQFPAWLLAFDYIMGMIMWTLIGRFAMGIFLREDSSFFFMRAFVKYTDPVIKLFGRVTPEFLVKPLVPLYVAWFFYAIPFLPDALVAGIFGNGHAFFPAGK